MAALPSYRELPQARGAGADGAGAGRSAWHLFGPDDLGLVNLQTPERIAAAAAEIRSGKTFALSAPVDRYQPPLYGRAAVSHRLLGEEGGAGYDDELNAFNPQASSQWDSLAHVPYEPGLFYNGVSVADIEDRHRNTIDHWARRGIAGRGVLFDAAAVLAAESGGSYSPGTPTAITVAHLEECARRGSFEAREGDVMLLYTGFDRWYLSQDDEVRRAVADERQLEAAGLEHSEEIAEYLWDLHVSAVVSDNPAVEVWPPDWHRSAQPFGFLHHTLIGLFGMPLGELWWLADLVDDCRQDGRHTCFLASAPLHVPGGVSSTPNALAFK